MSKNKQHSDSGHGNNGQQPNNHDKHKTRQQQMDQGNNQPVHGRKNREEGSDNCRPGENCGPKGPNSRNF